MDMKLILEYETSLRHAFVHPTPKLAEVGDSTFREAVFFTLTLDQVATLVDAAIRLVRRISGVVGSKFGDVGLWLYDRSADGSFPEQVFS